MITSDGSFGFNAGGELETVRRLGIDLKIILINNSSFGWINAASAARYGAALTDEFAEVKYVDVARAYGLDAFLAVGNGDLDQLTSFLSSDGPALMEVRTAPENELFPPRSRIGGSRRRGSARGTWGGSRAAPVLEAVPPPAVQWRSSII